jgi:hypothetical protein
MTAALALWLAAQVLSAPAPPPSAAGGGALVGGLAADSVQAFVTRLAPAVETLRGRRFRRPVPVHVEADTVAAAHFAARLARFLPPDERRAWERAHVALGLVRPDTDLQQLLLEVLAEQAGGYYDPDRDAFVLLGDMPAAALAVLVVHEMTHALDDQHFDIDSLLAIAAGDDDREAAFSAVVEGSGTWAMAVWCTNEIRAGRLDLEALAAFADTEAARAVVLQAAPDVLVRALLAPYVVGQVFLAGDGPAAAAPDSIAGRIDRAFRAPPASSEQVLHPVKYWDPDSLDTPSPIPIVDLAGILGSGFALAGDGVLGELGMAALTGPALDVGAIALDTTAAFTTPAASGWDGDRWCVWERGGAAVTVLASLWDTPRDAQEFETAARWPDGVHVERRGEAVVAVCGAPAATAPRVAAACFAALATAPAR